MIKLIPNTTASQAIRVRIRPVDESALPLTCSMLYEVGETRVTGSFVTMSTSYDTADFLGLSVAMNQPNNTSVRFEIFQSSGSTSNHRKIYQGEISFLSESVTERLSDAFESYTGSVTEYIIY